MRCSDLISIKHFQNDESERKVLNEFDDSVQEMRERYRFDHS